MVLPQRVPVGRLRCSQALLRERERNGFCLGPPVFDLLKFYDVLRFYDIYDQLIHLTIQ